MSGIVQESDALQYVEPTFPAKGAGSFLEADWPDDRLPAMLIHLLALSLAIQSKASSEPSNVLYRSCKVALAVESRMIRNPEDNDWLSTGDCTGYLHGFIEGQEWSPRKSFCVPEGTNFFTVAREYIEFVNKHESMKNDDNPSFGVLLFLNGAYPCSARK